MFLNTTSMRKLFLMTVMAAQFTACNEAEFFEKEYLTSDFNGDTNGSSCLGNCSTPGDDDVDLTPGGDDDVPVVPTITYQDITDGFNQNTSEKAALDILWVVDSSGSMGDEQESLAYNFDVFINDFVTKDIDFRMGITTTDSRDGYNGVAVGDFNLLDSSAAQNDLQGFLDYFSQSIKVGTRGSGTERGLNGAKQFIENYKTTWLRENAYLVIVQISDEKDQSTETTQSYIDHLSSLKANDRNVTVHSIVTIGQDQRYTEVTTAFNGTTSNIENNFHDILASMGGSILSLINSFPLTQQPADNIVSVFIDGIELSSGWTYDSGSNSVQFTEGNEPAEGVNIDIKYKVEVN